MFNKLIKALFKRKKPAHELRIGLLYYDRYPAAEQICNGFTSHFRKSYDISTFFVNLSANGNKDRLIDLMYEIADNEYDMILSIGTECTRVLKAFSDQGKINVPVVYTDVAEPLQVGIAPASDRPPSQFMGVLNISENYERRLEHIFNIIPHISTMVFAYDADEERSRKYATSKKIRSLCEQKNIIAYSIGIDRRNCDSEKLDALLKTQKFDLIFGLKQPLVMSNSAMLADCGQRFSTPFISSDLNSSQAAVTCGYDDFKIGQATAEQACAILRDKIQPEHLPLTMVSAATLIRTSNANMASQDFELCRQGKAWIEKNTRR